MSNKDVDAIPIKTITKKKGLPSISTNPDTETVEDSVPVKRKKRRTPVDADKVEAPTTDNRSSNENKPTPRKRRQPTNQATTAEESTPVSLTADKPVKKKKPKAASKEPSDATASPSAGEANQTKEGQGSKTSLITRDDDTPRKKQPRKKKKAKKSEAVADEFGDTPWAEDLRTMREDIISADSQVKEEQELGDTVEEKKQPISFITPQVLRSQPLDKIFIETSNRFKGQNKSTLSRQQFVETFRPIEPKPISRTTTIDFAIASHKIFRVVTLFLQGLTAGLSLWHMVMIYVLSSFSSDDFLQHYYRVSMPLHCSYYFLLIILTVSACDRFDLGNPTRRFLLRAFTLQNGAVAIIFSLVALILNVVLIKYDDRMYLYKEFTDLYSSESEKASDISTFQSINTARSAFIILTWLVLSLTPGSDRLGKNLRSGETGLERDHDLDKVSAA
ncbi:transmembrane protein 237-like [Biomphalaria glabrata]|uniref:Transmembrane protein 237-like n=1 Tax=Biomphalaria glabrata TaxID=6526 RepID=A0A9W3BJG3_BIOGL|nr:transmembrane protein 237-like [Biomphalaria glabrata]KAI8783702.1 transmembrane protein 237 [Biomphalaria glabrata]